MITVEATVYCETKDCKTKIKIPMARGYDDGVWNTVDDKLHDWDGIGSYFGQRESWSKAICPKCVAQAQAEKIRPKTLEERITVLENSR